MEEARNECCSSSTTSPQQPADGTSAKMEARSRHMESGILVSSTLIFDVLIDASVVSVKCSYTKWVQQRHQTFRWAAVTSPLGFSALWNHYHYCLSSSLQDKEYLTVRLHCTTTASPFLMSDCRTFVQWNSAALFGMDEFAYVFILIFQGSKNGVLCVLEYNAVLNVDVRVDNCKIRRRWLGKECGFLVHRPLL